MSRTGLPILISRNCVRASKNASRLPLAGKDLAAVRLAHTQSQKISLKQQHHQQGYGLRLTSYNCNALQRPMSTSTLQNSARIIRGLCAIKHSGSCQKNCKLFSSNICLSSSSRSSSTTNVTQLWVVPLSFHRAYSSKIPPRVHVGARSLCSKQDPPTSNKNDSKTEPIKSEEVVSDKEGIPKEAPVVIKTIKPSKDGKGGGKVETISHDNEEELTEKIKVEAKPYRLRRKKVDYSKKHTENITVTALRAMREYLLKPDDLKQLRKLTRRTPYDTNPNEPPLQVYLRRDVEEKAIEVWGSKEALQREQTARKKLERLLKDQYFLHSHDVKESDAFFGPQAKEKPPPKFFSSSGSHVVFSAICINAANFVCKSVAWAYSGSASMFSEAIHSAADTINQLILAWGIYSATKQPSKDHPYGFATLTYVSSLISGVGIFCVGAGLAFYHGIMGLIHPEPIESLYWSYCVLAGALLSEGATLMIAMDAIKKGAAKKKMTFFEYVLRSRNPSVNVVFLEDAAAVLGVLVAGSCMGLTSLTGNPLYDSVGSIAVGGILASVSGFLVYTNTEALVGRSIPEDQLIKINDMLVNDPVVRGVYDIKATDMGVGLVRFKAEIDFDGREVTRAYLDTQDPDALLKSVKTVQTSEELETFMLTHGEKGIDMLGSQVDRLEKEIKKLNPEVRHVDLEIL